MRQNGPGEEMVGIMEDCYIAVDACYHGNRIYIDRIIREAMDKFVGGVQLSNT